MLPCCARVCLVEVSRRPAEWSGHVWLKDKRLTGSRLFWSAKLKDKDKGIKDAKVEEKRTGTKRLARHLIFILKPVEWVGDLRPILSELVFTLLQIKGSQEFAFLPSCVVWIWKRLIIVFPQVSYGRCCWSMEYKGLHVNHLILEARCVFILGIRWPLDSERGARLPLSCLWYL